MIERDYIMRLIKQFFDALYRLKNKVNETNKEFTHTEIRDLYKEYFGRDYLFFHQTDAESLIVFVYENNRLFDVLYKMEMLAELIYNDALLTDTQEQQIDLFSKALNLYSHLEEKSNTFSMERQNKIMEISKLLAEKKEDFD